MLRNVTVAQSQWHMSCVSAVPAATGMLSYPLAYVPWRQYLYSGHAQFSQSCIAFCVLCAILYSLNVAGSQVGHLPHCAAGIRASCIICECIVRS